MKINYVKTLEDVGWKENSGRWEYYTTDAAYFLVMTLTNKLKITKVDPGPNTSHVFNSVTIFHGHLISDDPKQELELIMLQLGIKKEMRSKSLSVYIKK